MDVRATRATLGATVTNIDVRSVSIEAFAELEAVCHEHAVVIFPAQQFDGEAHTAFSRHFGPLEGLQTTAVEGNNPKSSWHLISAPMGSALFLQNKGNHIWHRDCPFKSNSAKASLLRAESCRGDRAAGSAARRRRSDLGQPLHGTPRASLPRRPAPHDVPDDGCCGSVGQRVGPARAARRRK